MSHSYSLRKRNGSSSTTDGKDGYPGSITPRKRAQVHNNKPILASQDQPSNAPDVLDQPSNAAALVKYDSENVLITTEPVNHLIIYRLPSDFTHDLLVNYFSQFGELAELKFHRTMCMFRFLHHESQKKVRAQKEHVIAGHSVTLRIANKKIVANFQKHCSTTLSDSERSLLDNNVPVAATVSISGCENMSPGSLVGCSTVESPVTERTALSSSSEHPLLPLALSENESFESMHSVKIQDRIDCSPTISLVKAELLQQSVCTDVPSSCTDDEPCVELPTISTVQQIIALAKSVTAQQSENAISEQSFVEDTDVCDVVYDFQSPQTPVQDEPAYGESSTIQQSGGSLIFSAGDLDVEQRIFDCYAYRKVSCPACPEAFESVVDAYIHCERQGHCAMCQRCGTLDDGTPRTAFVALCLLYNHSFDMHVPEYERYVCPLCRTNNEPLVYYSSTALVLKHMSHTHVELLVGDDLVRCALCPKGTAMTSSSHWLVAYHTLSAHMGLHSMNPSFACARCNKMHTNYLNAVKCCACAVMEHGKMKVL